MRKTIFMVIALGLALFAGPRLKGTKDWYTVVAVYVCGAFIGLGAPVEISGRK